VPPRLISDCDFVFSNWFEFLQLEVAIVLELSDQKIRVFGVLVELGWFLEHDCKVFDEMCKMQ
jgi:hypothetical protein